MTAQLAIRLDDDDEQALDDIARSLQCTRSEAARQAIREKAESLARIPSVFDRLIARDTIIGDPDDLIHSDWSGEWTG
jgi:hypothetical protein